eukprot:TRINITY_DN23_c0_g1_i1.p1 TRINITY_DN23_c0_g1~~TRINITY_DN23_c0_g1_i1.p1  ORF type:complete len:1732 (-),score=251.84 TRINITY_DN23_c0_g1_i1:9756-14951(-)
MPLSSPQPPACRNVHRPVPPTSLINTAPAPCRCSTFEVQRAPSPVLRPPSSQHHSVPIRPRVNRRQPSSPAVMRRILFAAARALRGSSADDVVSDASESVCASEDVVSTGSIPDAPLERVTAASTVPPQQPSSPAVRPGAPTSPAANGPAPATPTRRPSSRLPLEMRRIGASPDVMASPRVQSNYNLRSRRRVVASTRTDSVAMSRPAFLHKRDVENASTTTLRGVCSRFGIDATGTKEELRASALAKMAEKTADDFCARPVGEHDDLAPAAVDGECAEDRANCLTTSTTKKNLASVRDPIVRGAGDVHGKSDVPEADVNMPPVRPQMPVESRPARSWVTDRSVMEKPARQGPPPTPPLTLPRAALPPRGSPPSPINHPVESADVSAHLDAGSIFQDWLRTNRRLSAAEYEACVRALSRSVSDGNARRRPSGRASFGTGALGVAMVPSAIMKRVPTRSATLGLPSPVARNGLPTTPGVRSSTGIPASSRTAVTAVTQRLPQNEASHNEASRNIQIGPSHPVSQDVSSERNIQGAGNQDSRRPLQQSSQSVPVDTSSTAARKEAEGVQEGEHPLASKFSGAVGGPSDHNVERSGDARKTSDGEEGAKPIPAIEWMNKMLAQISKKDVPMKENPQYGDMVPPQQLLKHFNESKPSDASKRTAAKKKRWESPREIAARIRKKSQQDRREWEERVRVIEKACNEEAKWRLSQRNKIESETGGELIDLRDELNQKKTRHELAQIRAGFERPPSPPLPPRAQRALRFLKALREETARAQVEGRDMLPPPPEVPMPPIPPHLRKVRFRVKPPPNTNFPYDSTSESSVDYERPPDEEYFWKRVKRKNLRAQRKLKEKEAQEQDKESSPGISVEASKPDAAAKAPNGKDKQISEKKRDGDMEKRSQPKTASGRKSISQAELLNQLKPDPVPLHYPPSSLQRKVIRGPSWDLPNPFKTDPKPPSASSAGPKLSSSPFEPGKLTFGNSEQQSAVGRNEDHKNYSRSFHLDSSSSAKPRPSNPEQEDNEAKDGPTPFKPQESGKSKFLPSFGQNVKASFDLRNVKEQGGKSKEAMPGSQEMVRNSGGQRKRKVSDFEAPSHSPNKAVKVAFNNSNRQSSLIPSQAQRQIDVRNESDVAKGDIEPAGSNGKKSFPSLRLSSVPALANSQLPSARSGKKLSEEDSVRTPGISEGKEPALGAPIHRGGINENDATESSGGGLQREEHIPETGLFGIAKTPVAVSAKEAASTVKPEESPKQDKLVFKSLITKPTEIHSKEEDAPKTLTHTPSKPLEFPNGASIISNEKVTDSQPAGKEKESSVFSGKFAAPSPEQTLFGQAVQKQPFVQTMQEPKNGSAPGANPSPENGTNLDVPKSPSTKAEKAISFGAANSDPENPFKKPSFGAQVESGNPFNVKNAESTGAKPLEDIMTTNSPADRQESKPLFGMESKGVTHGTSFGGVKSNNVTPAPIFGSAEAQPPTAPFSFNKSVDIGQKQPGGPFGDSKFSSSFKSIGPASSFVFGTSEPSRAPGPSGSAPTPFSAGAPKAQTEQAKPNPFATPSNPSPFSAAPTGFGTSSQSQGFAFSGSSSAFGSSNPVAKPSSFGTPGFGNHDTAKAFGQGNSEPTFTFGAPGGSAPTFGAQSGSVAPNPFAANPPQNAFGMKPFGGQPESQSMYRAESNAPFSQGNLFGGSNNTQPGLSGRTNDSAANNNAFNPQGGQASGAGAFAMGSTATAAPRRKVKARRMLR